ncbi:MAG TPA: hypothetical protein VKT72_15685 [Candidatus Baltobacteraceae bacterium]|nr:hypothetical protein [Candidatus Baltobacteraceae bacterium]
MDQQYLITGIAPAGAQAAQLLAGTSLDETRLSAVSKNSAAAGAVTGEHGGPSFSSSSTIMTGSSGTGVPGIGGSNASLSSFAGHGGAPDYLGGVPLIPRDQAHNFNIAIAEGRTLVMYKAAPEEAPHIEAAFRNAGLRNVKVFRPKEPLMST